MPNERDSWAGKEIIRQIIKLEKDAILPITCQPQREESQDGYANITCTHIAMRDVV